MNCCYSDVLFAMQQLEKNIFKLFNARQQLLNIIICTSVADGITVPCLHRKL